MTHTLLNRLGWPEEESLPGATHLELSRLMLANVVPLSIMAVAFGVISVLVAADGPTTLFAAIAILGTGIGCGRIWISAIGQRRAFGVDRVASWERRYALGSYAFSLCVGALGASTFLEPSPVHHMLITALLFGYTSGVVSRGSCRPVIATKSLMLAAVPIILTITLRLATGDLPRPYLSLDLFILVFLVGSFETVRHVYRTILALLTTKAELEALARRDALTGLSNRFEIYERLERAGGRSVTEGPIRALHYLDLDGFKAVNDEFGHAAGDKLLELVARRLTSAVRRGDLVGRLGGDEFVIIQENLAEAVEAERLASRLVRILNQPYRLIDGEIHVGCSIGIAIGADGDIPAATLLARADRALYRIKAGGTPGYMVYEVETSDPGSQRE